MDDAQQLLQGGQEVIQLYRVPGSSPSSVQSLLKKVGSTSSSKLTRVGECTATIDCYSTDSKTMGCLQASKVLHEEISGIRTELVSRFLWLDGHLKIPAICLQRDLQNANTVQVAYA